MLYTNTSEKQKLIIPKHGAFAANDSSISRKRKELAEKLKNGQKVSVTLSGTAVDPNSPEAQQPDGKTLYIPDGKLADDSISKKRKELAEKLKKGQKVSVTPSGTAVDPNSPEAQQPDGKTLYIPDGKLANGFYWYERDPQLLEAEKKQCKRVFRISNSKN